MPKVQNYIDNKGGLLGVRITREEEEVIKTLSKKLRMSKSALGRLLIREALMTLHGIHLRNGVIEDDRER